MAFDNANSIGLEVLQPPMPEEKLSDHALIEATRNGDEKAFEEIVSRYRNSITNYLYRFLNDYEEAVDLAQETFVRVYRARDRYQRSYAFSTYIYRIATNLAISELRKAVRQREQRCVEGLLKLYAFRPQDAAASELPLLDGRWGDDLFNPETLKQLGVRVGGGSAGARPLRCRE